MGETHYNRKTILALNGFSETLVQAIIEVGLIEYFTKEYVPDEQDRSYLKRFPDAFIPEFMSWFELTPLGKTILEELDPNSL